ncbi:hypothetical protein RCC89_18480 [Cytophagaceae bacterium ABcell3]|nr:hypothetical protein RCC89_18480 [Cytophagaceae bacterium ABcell3]
MKTNLSLAIFVISAFFTVNLYAQDEALKDSLLQVYSSEELSSMTPFELYNAINVIRGQPVLKKSPQEINESLTFEQKYQLLGIFNQEVTRLEEEKRYFRQVVFPNSYRDVYDGYYDVFYKSQSTRELLQDNFKEIIDPIKEEENLHSNSTKRTFFMMRTVY